MSFKIKAPPGAEKHPAPIKAPAQKTLVPTFSANDDDARKSQSPDGPRAGYTVLPSGQRAFKDEIPYPPPVAPPKPMKVR
jgi:hypothetical protein